MRRRSAPPDLASDPFQEREGRPLRWSARVLGAEIVFSSNSRELLDLARAAFAGAPRDVARDARTTLRIRLRRVSGTSRDWTRPPRPQLSSGDGLLFGHVDARNFAVIDAGAGRGLVQVDGSMMRHRQLLRYELIEFATITLVTRARELVPLHAGCVGERGRGILLLGSSGAGKSTLALHAALGGLEFLAEDSVFVEPTTLRANGLSAYVHAREDALQLSGDGRLRRALRRAPVIERRSGVRKRAIDLRGALDARNARSGARRAAQPLRIVATVVLSTRAAHGAAPLVPLSASQLRRALRTEQPYALAQPGWRAFERRMLRLRGFRLDRMPPADGVHSLRTLLREEHA